MCNIYKNMSGGATEYGLKVFGSPTEQLAGPNGAIVTRPVMGGGKRKSHKQKQQKRRSKTSKRRYKKGGCGCGGSRNRNL